jgi:hypothetical protein
MGWALPLQWLRGDSLDDFHRKLSRRIEATRRFENPIPMGTFLVNLHMLDGLSESDASPSSTNITKAELMTEIQSAPIAQVAIK